METASYGGYDESITDYHPPVEQGDIPHPFKVTRYTNEDGEVKVRVRLGRFYYSSSVMTVAKLPHMGHTTVHSKCKTAATRSMTTPWKWSLTKIGGLGRVTIQV